MSQPEPSPAGRLSRHWPEVAAAIVHRVHPEAAGDDEGETRASERALERIVGRGQT